MKVALIKPPATYADWYRRPVLGLAYISACLEANGIEGRIFDAYYHSWTEKALLDRVLAYKPDLVGITAMTHEIVPAGRIASQLKKALGVPVVIGGCHVTALPERTLAEFPDFDFGVYGEGERTFLELAASLPGASKANLRRIKGLVFRDGEEIVRNEPRPFLTPEELGALPYPAFHHYYGRNSRALAGRSEYYVMFTTRGCPYPCAFCMQALGRRVRRCSTENICREIEYAITTYGAHTIDFADELFLFNTRESRDLLQAMIDKGLAKRIRWTGLARADFVTEELAALARKSGCHRLELGVESGDDEILKGIGKGITVAQVKKAVRIIKEAGIPLGTYFILGHPNETRETLEKTVDLAVELNTDTIAVGIMVPYPGTRVFEMARRGEAGYRLLTQDWSQYDKYGGKALEVAGLPYDDLVKWQRRAILNFYLKNFRFLDALRYLWQRRRAFQYLFKRWMGRFGNRGQ